MMKDFTKQGNREVVLDRKTAVILATGGAVAMVVIFALGVMFGRNMAGRKAQGEQSQNAAQAVQQEPKPVPGTTAETPDLDSIPAKIDAQSVDGLDKGSTVKNTAAKDQMDNKGLEKVLDKNTKVTLKPGDTASKNAAKKTDTVKTDTTTTKTDTAKTNAKADTAVPAKGKYAIQVASYPDKASADQLAGKLKANKWKAFSLPTDIPNKGTYYRVYVGDYATRDVADTALKVFKDKETKYKDSFIRKLD
jgi:cell division septation protein DedD